MSEYLIVVAAVVTAQLLRPVILTALVLVSRRDTILDHPLTVREVLNLIRATY